MKNEREPTCTLIAIILTNALGYMILMGSLTESILCPSSYCMKFTLDAGRLILALMIHKLKVVSQFSGLLMINLQSDLHMAYTRVTFCSRSEPLFDLIILPALAVTAP